MTRIDLQHAGLDAALRSPTDATEERLSRTNKLSAHGRQRGDFQSPVISTYVVPVTLLPL